MSELSFKQIKKEWHGSLKAYAIGFIASLVLTTAAFLLVITKNLDGTTLAYTLVALALVQAFFQLLFFLHVGQEPKPRWETLTFCFMFVILLIVAIGTLWIMHDLNERMMPNMNEMKGMSEMKEMNHD
jgi:cytochrome o ubiquinol oxidase operon protein cyoD